VDASLVPAEELAALAVGATLHIFGSVGGPIPDAAMDEDDSDEDGGAVEVSGARSRWRRRTPPRGGAAAAAASPPLLRCRSLRAALVRRVEGLSLPLFRTTLALRASLLADAGIAPAGARRPGMAAALAALRAPGAPSAATAAAAAAAARPADAPLPVLEED
jgi:hypothetical protein